MTDEINPLLNRSLHHCRTLGRRPLVELRGGQRDELETRQFLVVPPSIEQSQPTIERHALEIRRDQYHADVAVSAMIAPRPRAEHQHADRVVPGSRRDRLDACSNPLRLASSIALVDDT
ncbi:hypothetical protein BRC86_06190 [Halobacteriales archaeon QS_3_64_16]|nr:MAG: hypothetical protein BRC86_06190 [Halobacteriales archaeon QS_3_64_16]